MGILKQIALTQPNVKSATDGSIYDVMNATNSVKYDVVHLSQTKHITDEETDTYGFNIFYVSRLEDSLEDNRLQIQSIGKEVLDNILRTFCENWNIDYPEIIFYPFTQKFADLCAGVYCKVEIEIPKELICADDYIDEVTPRTGIKLENIKVEIDQNGTREVTPSPGFDGIGKVTIVTDVTGGSCDLEYKEVEYTENGEYTILPSSGYDGLSEIAISVDVDDRYDEGYADGFAAGASACSGYFITALTLNVDSAITDYGTATTTYSPSTAITDIYYTSSDPSIATIDSGTGVITVLSNGTVTICAKDGITHLQDCKQVNVTKSPSPEPTDYLTFVILSGGNIVWSVYGDIEARTIQYQKNGGEWISITATEQGAAIPVQAGDIVKFKGNNSYYAKQNPAAYNSFSGSTTIFNLEGNIMSLLYGDNYQTAATIEAADAFSEMFRYCSGLISAENLVLPATTLASHCYGHMFANCNNMTKSPKQLPATTLANHCYCSMFSGCTSLTTAPELPATTLASDCYLNMFWDCTSLTTAPVLSATTLAYSCYYGMFSGCRNLRYIKCLATDISAYGSTTYWVDGVSASGTFVKDPNMTWPTGTDGIPSGWTIIDNT